MNISLVARIQILKKENYKFNSEVYEREKNKTDYIVFCGLEAIISLFQFNNTWLFNLENKFNP